MFHPVTSSPLLLCAKWSIRQASYTTMCSLKNTLPARINNSMLYSQIESSVESAGLSQTRWVDLHQPPDLEEKKSDVRSQKDLVSLFCHIAFFNYQNEHIYNATSKQNKKNDSHSIKRDLVGVSCDVTALEDLLCRCSWSSSPRSRFCIIYEWETKSKKWSRINSCENKTKAIKKIPKAAIAEGAPMRDSSVFSFNDLWKENFCSAWCWWGEDAP